MQIELTFKVTGEGKDAIDCVSDAVGTLKAGLSRWDFNHTPDHPNPNDPPFLAGTQMIETGKPLSGVTGTSKPHSWGFTVDVDYGGIITPDGTARLLPCEACHACFWVPANVVSHICDPCANARDDEEDEPDEDAEPPECPACSGPGIALGTLGRRAHFRCRNCGMDFSHDTAHA
jgi:hypothetical protein